MGHDVCVYNSYYTGIARFLDLPFVDVLIQNASRPYISRRSALLLISGYRTKPVRCSYGVPLRFDTKRKAVVW